MNDVMNMNQQAEKTMSSQEIAELTGKRHAHVMRDVRNMLDNLEVAQSTDLGCEDNKGLTIKYDSHTKRVSEYLLNRELADLLLSRYEGLLRMPTRTKERASLETIEQLLGVELTYQYPVLGYRVDGYDTLNNIAYEVDEPQHLSGRAWLDDLHRQREIEKHIGCSFVRIAVS
jgi:hypothetical protein